VKLIVSAEPLQSRRIEERLDLQSEILIGMNDQDRKRHKKEVEKRLQQNCRKEARDELPSKERKVANCEKILHEESLKSSIYERDL
jgi:hypothetical protein